MTSIGGKLQQNLRPIENCWGSLKQFLRSTYKPKNFEELMNGIEELWQTFTPEVCTRYIRQVMPKVIEEDGNPSGY